jgi:hypothetical protein
MDDHAGPGAGVTARDGDEPPVELPEFRRS